MCIACIPAVVPAALSALTLFAFGSATINHNSTSNSQQDNRARTHWSVSLYTAVQEDNIHRTQIIITRAQKSGVALHDLYQQTYDYALEQKDFETALKINRLMQDPPQSFMQRHPYITLATGCVLCTAALWGVFYFYEHMGHNHHDHLGHTGNCCHTH